MASNVLCGQAGLLQLPPVRKSKSGDKPVCSMLADAKLHPYLRVDRKKLKSDSRTGIEVFKISKNGKLQARRLGISPDNRCLLVTTNRVNSFKSFLKVATGNTHDPSSTKVIDVSRIDRLIKGQLSKRFLMENHHSDDLAAGGGTHSQSNSEAFLEQHEATSITIVYRQTRAERLSSLSLSSATEAGDASYGGRIGSSISGGLNKTVNMNASVSGDESTIASRSIKSKGQSKGHGKAPVESCAYYGGYECLDLCITDPKDFQQLVETLEELMELYKKERRWMERSVLLYQHHRIDMGRTDVSDPISPGDWISLCDRLNAPLRRPEIKSLYKDMQNELKRACKELGTELDFLDSGLPPWAVAELLKDLHFQSTTAMGLKYTKQDPTLRLWHEILDSDPVPILNKDGSKNNMDTKMINQSASTDTTISPVALLSFIRSQQKEFKASLEDATEIIKAVKAQKSFKHLAAETGDAGNGNNPGGGAGDGRLTKDEFMNFLLSDTNDLMDPRKGKVNADDMTHPLSSYWIMSSHDTYLDCWNPDHIVLDEQMYLAALYRGVKCLELDIFDDCSLAPKPVIAREKPTSVDDPCISVRVALRAIRQYLVTNENSFPIIVNIENHCSYEAQEKLADYIYEDLGSIGLIVVPDNSGSIDSSDLLPSPASMKGRVLIMGKRPSIVEDGAKVINDDFDDENDVSIDEADFAIPNVKSEDGEDSERGIVVGFDAKGPIRVYNEREQKNTIEHSPGELLYIAKQELETAELQAAQVEMKAIALEEASLRVEKYADALIRNAGLSDEAVAELLQRLNGEDIDPDRHLDSLPRRDEGVEVEDFFADAVNSAKLTFAKADQFALQAAEETNRALQQLNQATERLHEAEKLRETSFVKGKRVVSKFQKAAKIAREKQENAAHAHRRVEKLRQMLEECETGANSANNVVNTAMTEAKISEKRAAETEARAARAAAIAQKDRARAEEETRKEEILEQEAGLLHEKLLEIARKEKEVRMEAQRCAATYEKLSKQIKLIENSRQFIEEEKMEGELSEENKEFLTKGGKVHSKHAAKVEERNTISLRMDQMATEISEAAKLRTISQDAFEKKAHEWKSQADTAAKFRRVVDKSSHAAEDLAEHAEEEREAANLRKVARDRAQSHVTQKDSYKSSLEAQLAEAERHTVVADGEAVASRKEADRLAKANESYENSGFEDISAIIEGRKLTRTTLLAEYEKKKENQKAAEEKAAELKKEYETSDNVFSGAKQNSALHEKVLKNQRQEDKNALLAVNSAKATRMKAQLALEEARYAQSVVSEKLVVVKRAEEYKLKTERVVEIPTQLANMTFLHTLKQKYWERSLQLPSTHVHSFADCILDKLALKNKDSFVDNLKNFTSSHLCRTFRSWKDAEDSSQLNTDPLSQWSLGCQLVSLNFSTYDEHLQKADGRFRRNGSCGYTLKPEFLRSYDSIPERPESWKIHVLSGSYLPTPDSKQVGGNAMSYINPFVKINVYGGDLGQRKGEHVTSTVMMNGLNPVFDDKMGFIFKATSPSLAILTFTVWDKAENGTEEFIGGSAMPLSCIREGYRSVPLFDKQNTRGGAFAYACLLVKAKRMT
ncbi:unnamed protein product [Pseudo-nitzschia multistriata]|uniref:Phosphoinositide phospholipase C n=1 Tax=Pseudo-nitzschia multistriata TaxID=183589 RepID=A0A448YZB1_9STRA|nr:unnamed protein product [Pseudo-nitzschia multistriata]